MESILTVAGITSILVTIFTLVFQYFPGLRVKWAGLASEVKRLVVLGLYLALGALIAFGGCVAVLADLIPQLMCSDAMGYGQFAIAVLIAVGAGQGVFELLPETADVVAAKAAR